VTQIEDDEITDEEVARAMQNGAKNNQLNEAVITFVTTESADIEGYNSSYAVTQVFRVEFEGPIEDFMQSVEMIIRVVNVEQLKADNRK